MSTTKEKSIKTRTIEAAKRHLSMNGYELKSTWDTAEQFGFVAKDGGVLAFIQLVSNGIEKGSFPDEPTADRGQFEQVVIEWFTDHNDADTLDMPIRFDVLSLKVLCEERALVRHHVNALGLCQPRDLITSDIPSTCM